MLADSGRRQAQRLYRAHDCVRCGATDKTARIERHHIDGDTTHNSPGNVETPARSATAWNTGGYPWLCVAYAGRVSNPSAGVGPRSAVIFIAMRNGDG